MAVRSSIKSRTFLFTFFIDRNSLATLQNAPFFLPVSRSYCDASNILFFLLCFSLYLFASFLGPRYSIFFYLFRENWAAYVKQNGFGIMLSETKIQMEPFFSFQLRRTVIFHFANFLLRDIFLSDRNAGKPRRGTRKPQKKGGESGKKKFTEKLVIKRALNFHFVHLLE